MSDCECDGSNGCQIRRFLGANDPVNPEPEVPLNEIIVDGTVEDGAVTCRLELGDAAAPGADRPAVMIDVVGSPELLRDFLNHAFVGGIATLDGGGLDLLDVVRAVVGNSGVDPFVANANDLRNELVVRGLAAVADAVHAGRVSVDDILDVDLIGSLFSLATRPPTEALGPPPANGVLVDVQLPAGQPNLRVGFALRSQGSPIGMVQTRSTGGTLCLKVHSGVVCVRNSTTKFYASSGWRILRANTQLDATCGLVVADYTLKWLTGWRCGTD
jgi:hypothetical protein